MKFPAFAFALAVLALPAARASAEPLALNCSGDLIAVGVSSGTEGGRDFERYKGQVPPGLARRRAIDNWEQQVTSACPRHSAYWWRSRNQRIACEGTAGREYCTATAAPAKKFLSFLMP